MSLNITSIKNQIKSQPAIILKKPWFLFLVPLIFVKIILNRFKKKIIRVYLLESDLCELIPNRINDLSKYNFKIIKNYEEFSAYSEQRIKVDNEVGEDYRILVNKRFESGDFAIVYLNKEESPLSFIFIATKTAVFQPVNLTLVLPRKTFGMYDVYTYKEERGKGYYSRLFEFAITYMKNQSFEKLWLWLMDHNTISIDVHKRLGLSRIIKVLSEKVKFGIVKKEIALVEMTLSELTEA